MGTGSIDPREAEIEELLDTVAYVNGKPFKKSHSNATGRYVARLLTPKSAKQLRAWLAKQPGFDAGMVDDNLHVTLAHSSVDFPYTPDKKPLKVTPVGWEVLGDGNMERAFTLRVDSAELNSRWQGLVEAGAEWDYPTYLPHVTLCYLSATQDTPDLPLPPFALELAGEVTSPIGENSFQSIKKALLGPEKAVSAPTLWATLRKYNTRHYPAGSSKGGQFAPRDAVAFQAGETIPKGTVLNGVPFEPWVPPDTVQEWQSVTTDANSFSEPPVPVTDMRVGAGVIIAEPDGKVWIVEPMNHYGGYKHTFPKGTVEPGMDLRETAVKEAFEETGLHVELTGWFGDYERDTSIGRYYWAKRVGGTPTDHGDETWKVKLVPADQLHLYMNREVDKDISKDVESVTQGKPILSAQVPSLTASDITHKKIGAQGGSNPGGFYEGTDGVERYVKFYSDPTQASEEHLANQLYNDLGIAAPRSIVIKEDGKTLYASRVIKKLEELGPSKPSQEQARSILKGFAADVLTGNWDAVGLVGDNIGFKYGKPYRLDNGGTFEFRAKAGKKKPELLPQITEWDNFANPAINPSYAQVITAAGYTPEQWHERVSGQVHAIKSLRDTYGSWSAYVNMKAPLLGAKEKITIADMLEERTKKMLAKLSSGVKKYNQHHYPAGSPKGGQFAPAGVANVPAPPKGLEVPYSQGKGTTAQNLNKKMAAVVEALNSDDPIGNLAKIQPYKESSHPVSVKFNTFYAEAQGLAKDLAAAKSAVKPAPPIGSPTSPDTHFEAKGDFIPARVNFGELEVNKPFGVPIPTGLTQKAKQSVKQMQLAVLQSEDPIAALNAVKPSGFATANYKLQLLASLEAAQAANIKLKPQQPSLGSATVTEPTAFYNKSLALVNDVVEEIGGDILQEHGNPIALMAIDNAVLQNDNVFKQIDALSNIVTSGNSVAETYRETLLYKLKQSAPLLAEPGTPDALGVKVPKNSTMNNAYFNWKVGLIQHTASRPDMSVSEKVEALKAAVTNGEPGAMRKYRDNVVAALEKKEKGGWNAGEAMSLALSVAASHGVTITDPYLNKTLNAMVGLDDAFSQITALNNLYHYEGYKDNKALDFKESLEEELKKHIQLTYPTGTKDDLGVTVPYFHTGDELYEAKQVQNYIWAATHGHMGAEEFAEQMSSISSHHQSVTSYRNDAAYAYKNPPKAAGEEGPSAKQMMNLGMANNILGKYGLTGSSIAYQVEGVLTSYDNPYLQVKALYKLSDMSFFGSNMNAQAARNDIIKNLKMQVQPMYPAGTKGPLGVGVPGYALNDHEVRYELADLQSTVTDLGLDPLTFEQKLQIVQSYKNSSSDMYVRHYAGLLEDAMAEKNAANLASASSIGHHHPTTSPVEGPVPEPPQFTGNHGIAKWNQKVVDQLTEAANGPDPIEALLDVPVSTNNNQAVKDYQKALLAYHGVIGVDLKYAKPKPGSKKKGPETASKKLQEQVTVSKELPPKPPLPSPPPINPKYGEDGAKLYQAKIAALQEAYNSKDPETALHNVPCNAGSLVSYKNTLQQLIANWEAKLPAKPAELGSLLSTYKVISDELSPGVSQEWKQFPKRHHSDYNEYAHEYRKALSYDQKSILSSYQGGGYMTINDSLRQAGSLDKLPPHQKAQYSTLQDLLVKAPPMALDTFLIRNLSSSALATKAKSLVGMTVEDPAFGSSSLDGAFGKGRNVSLRINAPQGTKGLYLNYSGSTEPYEKEWLIPSGTRYYVNGYEYKDGITHIYMTVLPANLQPNWKGK